MSTIDDKIMSVKGRTMQLGVAALAFLTVAAAAARVHAQEWVANLTIAAQGGGGSAGEDYSLIGAKNGSTRNADTNDWVGPPHAPGVRLYTEPDNNASNIFLRNCYIGVNDTNKSFRSFIGYDFAPTSSVVTASGLPSSDWAMLTFSNGVYQGLDGVYKITNGVPVKIGVNVRSLILTPSPVCTDFSAQQSSQNPSNLDARLGFKFDCYNAIPRLDIASSQDLAKYPITNNVGFAAGTNGIYSGTASNRPEKAAFYAAQLKR